MIKIFFQRLFKFIMLSAFSIVDKITFIESLRDDQEQLARAIDSASLKRKLSQRNS